MFFCDGIVLERRNLHIDKTGISLSKAWRKESDYHGYCSVWIHLPFNANIIIILVIIIWAVVLILSVGVIVKKLEEFWWSQSLIVMDLSASFRRRLSRSRASLSSPGGSRWRSERSPQPPGLLAERRPVPKLLHNPKSALQRFNVRRRTSKAFVTFLRDSNSVSSHKKYPLNLT